MFSQAPMPAPGTTQDEKETSRPSVVNA